MNTELVLARNTLDYILKQPDSIKNHIETVYGLWKTFREYEISPEETEKISSLIKSRVQQEAEEAFVKSPNGFGAAYMSTGSGKSRIAINLSNRLIRNLDKPRILVVVPTQRLRDDGWKNEYNKWSGEGAYENNILKCCYKSLHKYIDQDFALVILDEVHNITYGNLPFFKKNRIERCIAFTATEPKDKDKLDLLKLIGIKPVYRLSLDESVKLGMVAPYDITIINMTIDAIRKYIPSGSKKRPFMGTEKGVYNYLTRKKDMRGRMHFIYNLESKTTAAKLIRENVIPKNLRTIIFCGSKAQADQLSPYRYYSKPTKPKAIVGTHTEYRVKKYNDALAKYERQVLEYQGNASLEKFINGEIDEIACCDSLNEGHNLPFIDVGFVVQLSRNEKDFIQRLGRVLRFRPGHIGKLIILCVSDTIDKTWCEEALASLEASNIEIIELSRLRMGIETISFK